MSPESEHFSSPPEQLEVYFDITSGEPAVCEAVSSQTLTALDQLLETKPDQYYWLESQLYKKRKSDINNVIANLNKLRKKSRLRDAERPLKVIKQLFPELKFQVELKHILSNNSYNILLREINRMISQKLDEVRINYRRHLRLIRHIKTFDTELSNLDWKDHKEQTELKLYNLGLSSELATTLYKYTVKTTLYSNSSLSSVEEKWFRFLVNVVNFPMYFRIIGGFIIFQVFDRNSRNINLIIFEITMVFVILYKIRTEHFEAIIEQKIYDALAHLVQPNLAVSGSLPSLSEIVGILKTVGQLPPCRTGV